MGQYRMGCDDHDTETEMSFDNILSLVTPKVVILTTFRVVNDDNVDKMTTFTSQNDNFRYRQ